MSDTKYEVIQWVEGSKRPARLGYAKPDGKGGFYVNLSSLPLSAVGRFGTVELRIQEQRPFGEQVPTQGSEPPTEDDSKDDIPF